MTARRISVPKYAVVEDSAQLLVLENRGSRFAGFVIFGALAAFFFFAYSIPRFGAAARMVWLIVAVLATVAALICILDRERFVFNLADRTLTYSSFLRPWRAISAPAEAVAATEITSRVAAFYKRSGRVGGTSSEELVTFHSLWLILRDGRRIELNRSADHDHIRTLKERVDSFLAVHVGAAGQ